ncbi:MAG: SH3 domain-containing protein [Anaerolineales bacterium]|nr:SH3 domain-containing protein [Anaerolineales bacterium]
MSMRITTSLFFILLIVTLSACNLPLVESPETADLALTITAQAQELELLVQNGQTETPTITASVEQTNIEITATEEVVVPAPVVQVTVPVGAVTVTVSVATNCRQGPSSSFANVYGMPVGQVAKVVAKNTYSGYWIIEIPNKNGQTCWLWGQYATVTGDTASLTNVVTPTSVATKKPTTTITATLSSSGAIAGCTDSTASNYNSAATVDNGSCTYVGPALIGGCIDPNATNYNPAANADDGSCKYKTEPPIITNASVSCEDQLDGNYKFTFTINWLKNNTRSGLDYKITYQWEDTDDTTMSYEEIPVSTSPVIYTEIKPAGWDLEIDFIIADRLGLTIGARSDAVELTCP